MLHIYLGLTFVVYVFVCIFSTEYITPLTVTGWSSSTSKHLLEKRWSYLSKQMYMQTLILTIMFIVAWLYCFSELYVFWSVTVFTSLGHANLHICWIAKQKCWYLLYLLSCYNTQYYELHLYCIKVIKYYEHCFHCTFWNFWYMYFHFHLFKVLSVIEE